MIQNQTQPWALTGIFSKMAVQRVLFFCVLGLLLLGISSGNSWALPQQKEAASLDNRPASETAKAIQTVLQSRWMSVEQDGQFHAEKVVTRAELASILVKSFELEKRKPVGATPPATQYLDVPPTHWAYPAIQLVLQHGVMSGYDEKRFMPDQPITRAEGFAILAQADGVYPFGEPYVNEILSPYADAGKIPVWARRALATAVKEGFVNVQTEPRTGSQAAQNILPLAPMRRSDLAYALARLIKRQSQPSPFGEMGRHRPVSRLQTESL
ncbi:MAG: S-layer homology domain-containing protein [Candidatus Melainabacteria bacterium]|nr:S-layer homology domain-containing protein [Candidatus Melainabacteria bacterium]